MAIALIEHEACGLAFEFSGKGTTLFGHQTPLSGEHSRLNGCPVSLDHYMIGLIDGWNGKLTWDALCGEAESLIGTRPTRQTLNAHARIKSAFGDKKAQQKAGFKPMKRPESLAIAEQRTHRLESENQRLKAENNRLLERFVRWQYNAQKRGLSHEVLDAPLPEIDRDSAEKGKASR